MFSGSRQMPCMTSNSNPDPKSRRRPQARLGFEITLVRAVAQRMRLRLLAKALLRKTHDSYHRRVEVLLCNCGRSPFAISISVHLLVHHGVECNESKPMCTVATKMVSHIRFRFWGPSLLTGGCV